MSIGKKKCSIIDDRQTDLELDNGWMDRWIDGWIDGWMNGWWFSDLMI